MNIIQINSTLNTGSTGRIAYQIHKELKKRKNNSSIIFCYGDANTPDSLCLYSKLSTHLHSFLSRILCMQGRCSILQTLKTVKYIKKYDPDIIHLHNIHGHYINYPILFKFLRHRKRYSIVWTFHDCWPFTGKCAHYFNIGCNKWKYGCEKCQNLKTYPDSIYDGSKKNYRLKKKYFTQLSNLMIVCNSSWLASQVKQSFFRGNDIRIISNGIDTDKFKYNNTGRLRKKFNIPENKFIVLGVSGVWKKSKGVDVFFELADKLDNDYIIVLVGMTDSQERDLPYNILSYGNTENMEELAEIYSEADVLINPSKEETFGMVAVEAMACGTPVIVSNTTACPETVNKRTGEIVNMDNFAEICDALRKIRMNGKEYYKDACIKHVTHNYSKEKMINNYIDLYQELIYSHKN